MPPPNANGWNNSSVTVTLRATDNPGGIVKQIEYSLSGAQSGPSQTAQGNTAVIDLAVEGITQVHYAATDVAGNSEASKTLTVRIDRTAPVISGLSGGGCTLWPPNHKLVQVATVTAADALSGVAPDSLAITGASNEPAGPDGPDVVAERDGAGGFVVAVRADRLGKGTGRIYTLRATVSDLAGNAATTTGTCVVSHDQGK